MRERRCCRCYAFVHGGFHFTPRLNPCPRAGISEQRNTTDSAVFHERLREKTPSFLPLVFFNKAVELSRPGHPFQLMLSGIGKGKARALNEREG